MRRRDVIGLAASLSLFGRQASGAGAPKYRVAYLALVPGEDVGYERVFANQLRDLGYVEGQNLSFSFRSAEGHAERLSALAMELVQSKPDVLVSGFGTLAAKAAAAATQTIPVVFTSVGDPLGAGIVDNLSRPGRNITGSSSQVAEISGKRLQLILDLAPDAKQVGILGNFKSPFSALALKALRASPEDARVKIVVLDASHVEDIAARFKDVAAQKLGAMIVLEDPLMVAQRQNIAAAAALQGVPVLYGIRDFPVAGGLASYGPDLRQNYRRTATYVDKILKGANPGDLPVEQPTAFEFVVNLTVARKLGLSISPDVLARADDVIE